MILSFVCCIVLPSRTGLGSPVEFCRATKPRRGLAGLRARTSSPKDNSAFDRSVTNQFDVAVRQARSFLTARPTTADNARGIPELAAVVGSALYQRCESPPDLASPLSSIVHHRRWGVDHGPD